MSTPTQTANSRQPVVIDPAKNEKPVFFHEEDWEKQQMACELMDLREEVHKLSRRLAYAEELKEYWEHQCLEVFRTRKQLKDELQNKIIYDAIAEEVING